MQKGIIIVLLLIVNIGWSNGYNPDGRYLQPGVGLYYGHTAANNFNVDQGLLSVSLPVSNYFTLLTSGGYTGGSGSENGFLAMIGLNIFTEPIENLNELINPDGLKGSLIFSAIAGIDYIDRLNNGLNCAASIGFISGNTTTIGISYNYSNLSSHIIQSALLNFNLHNLPATDRELINPDGRVGSLTTGFSAGGIFTEQASGYNLGLGLLYPANTIMTLQAEYAYLGFSQSSSSSFLIGCIIYF